MPLRRAMLKTQRSALLALGLSTACLAMALGTLVLHAYAGFEARDSAFETVVAFGLLVFPACGALVVSRQPYNWIGWLFFVMGMAWIALMLASAYANVALDLKKGALPGGTLAVWMGEWVWLPAIAIPTTFPLLLFPDGRLLGPRWRVVAWAAGVALALAVSANMFEPREMEELARNNPALAGIDNPLGLDAPYLADVGRTIGWLGVFVLTVCALASAASLIMRFRRAQGVERQQLKWFAYAAGLLALCLLLQVIGYAVADEDLGPVRVSIGVVEAFGAVLVLGLFGLPVAATMAILRHNLYDIDRIINRTLTYGLLTAGLGATYFGLVVGLQALLRPVSGGNDLAIAVTTLLVAGLFLPARRRIQRAVDRRFNRRQYDAAHTMDAFSNRLREHIDLDTLRYEVLAVVHETMQPAKASLWLRDGSEVRQ